jgi:hypothetical protein
MHASSRTQKKGQLSFFRNRAVAGFTLLELTVASVVSLTILSLSMGMLNEQRRQILGDRTRAGVNDNLRIASDLIGFDIKQAGERLESDTEMPGISIIPGATAAVPSRLVLQRQLLTEKLTACQSISAGTGGTTTIDVSVVSSSSSTPATPGIATCPYSYTVPPPIAPATVGVEPSATLTTLQPTENLRAWRTYRCRQGAPFTGTTDPCTRTATIPATPATSNCQQLGGTDTECSWAYIRDPINHRGEFFLYSFENTGTCAYSTYSARTCQRIQRADGNTWQFSYTYDPTKTKAEQPQIYILEQREYRLTPDTDTSRTDDYVLDLSVNGLSPKRIANQFTDFQARASLSAGLASTFNSGLTFVTDWQTLQGVQITFNSINPNTNVLKDNSASSFLTLTSQFLPRNTLSQ